MTIASLLLSAAIVVGAPAPPAQEPVPDVRNPSAVEFEPSADHAAIDDYELEILRPDGSVLQTLNIGKPACPANLCTAGINVQPAAFATGYSMRLRARAGSVYSDYTVSLNKFDRVPGGPTKLTIR